MNAFPTGRPLVLYDGVCGLCDRVVRVLLKRDKNRTFLFAPLQGPTAQDILKRHSLSGEGLKSLVLVLETDTPQERVLLRSDAVLVIGFFLGGWPRFWGRTLRAVPPGIRDTVYNWVARRRYQWFGKFAECRLPTPEEKNRFLP